ncbi:MAG: hypothetical protein ACJAWL_002489 [Motiliproteus sp.]|jgi:hypothetical protein
MISGSCLCGKVEYSVTDDVGDIVHCHCKTCRKAHGSAFSSVAAISGKDFKLSGRELLSFFESSAGKKRYFCSNCGTHVYAKREGKEHIILRLGSLDHDPEAKEKSHIWVSEKASWYEINSQLPEYQQFE